MADDENSLRGFGTEAASTSRVGSTVGDVVRGAANDWLRNSYAVENPHQWRAEEPKPVPPPTVSSYAVREIPDHNTWINQVYF